MGEIYLHRNKKNPDFDEEDIFILKLMQPHVSTVFNIIHTLNAVKYLETSDNRNNNVLGICIFDSDMSLTGGNVTGYDMLKIVSAYGSSILYHIKELCSDINLISNKTAFEFFKSSSLKIQKGELSILILVNNDKTTKNKIQYITILQYTDEAAAVLDYQFKFTKREADIIDNLIQGKNNSQISKALNMSENTVKTHIKNIYKKTGTSNRTELTYMLMVNP
jgi:DNA-binding CsgD family transcriptional regulator